MPADASQIRHPLAQRFYAQHLQQRRIIREFYELLPEEAYDQRIVDSATRRADSPRESLAHIIATQRIYVRGAQTGRLTFEGPGAEAYQGLPRRALLDELDRLGAELLAFLCDEGFDPHAPVTAPWGMESALSALYLIRDHDILHVGWNLAIMDVVGMERFPALRDYWG